MDSLELSPSVFSILSGLIEEKVGLHYGLLDRELLRTKASARAQEAGFNSLMDYYYFLRYDAASEAELGELIDTLVVNETYFFREWAPIQMLVDAILEPLIEAGRRPRIWSAACATGEEPLSLAMLLDQRGLLDQVEITASDISGRALARAQGGVFSSRAVRVVPDPILRERYVQKRGPGFAVAPELRARILWRKQNLLNTESYAQLGKFDVIICRNVLIYFSDPTIRKVLAGLDQALARDGSLLVGVSESLLRYGSCFQGEERDGSFFYRKVGRA